MKLSLVVYLFVVFVFQTSYGVKLQFVDQTMPIDPSELDQNKSDFEEQFNQVYEGSRKYFEKILDNNVVIYLELYDLEVENIHEFSHEELEAFSEAIVMNVVLELMEEYPSLLENIETTEEIESVLDNWASFLLYVILDYIKDLSDEQMLNLAQVNSSDNTENFALPDGRIPTEQEIEILEEQAEAAILDFPSIYSFDDESIMIDYATITNLPDFDVWIEEYRVNSMDIHGHTIESFYEFDAMMIDIFAMCCASWMTDPFINAYPELLYPHEIMFENVMESEAEQRLYIKLILFSHYKLLFIDMQADYNNNLNSLAQVKKETTEEELSPEEYEIMLDVIEMKGFNDYLFTIADAVDVELLNAGMTIPELLLQTESEIQEFSEAAALAASALLMEAHDEELTNTLEYYTLMISIDITKILLSMKAEVEEYLQ